MRAATSRFSLDGENVVVRRTYPTRMFPHSSMGNETLMNLQPTHTVFASGSTLLVHVHVHVRSVLPHLLPERDFDALPKHGLLLVDEHAVLCVEHAEPSSTRISLMIPPLFVQRPPRPGDHALALQFGK